MYSVNTTFLLTLINYILLSAILQQSVLRAWKDRTPFSEGVNSRFEVRGLVLNGNEKARNIIFCMLYFQSPRNIRRTCIKHQLYQASQFCMWERTIITN